MKPLNVKYVFRLPDDRQELFEVHIDPEKMALLNGIPETIPQWTKLEFEQCPNCPLESLHHSQCPLAIRLVKLIGICENLLSYDKVRVCVATPERIVYKNTTAQKGISALMGLIMATSGCPLMGFFKPMARFHLPFASEDETIYRATSMYLLAQFFLRQQGKEADLELKGLTKIYQAIQILNTSMARRIRAAIREDAAVNAIILLDFFAKTLPYAVEESLDEIRYLFEPFLSNEQVTYDCS